MFFMWYRNGALAGDGLRNTYTHNNTAILKFLLTCCRQKTAENDNAKKNVSPNLLSTFCSSKLVYFFKFSFQKIYFSDKF